jgi:hypothetical protein
MDKPVVRFATVAVIGNNGAVRMTTTTDQFRWDVPLDPNEFKAKIPPDYTEMGSPKP